MLVSTLLEFRAHENGQQGLKSVFQFILVIFSYSNSTQSYEQNKIMKWGLINNVTGSRPLPEQFVYKLCAIMFNKILLKTNNAIYYGVSTKSNVQMPTFLRTVPTLDWCLYAASLSWRRCSWTKTCMSVTTLLMDKSAKSEVYAGDCKLNAFFSEG